MQLSLYLPNELGNTLRKVAYENHTSAASVVQQALLEFYAKHGIEIVNEKFVKPDSGLIGRSKLEIKPPAGEDGE